MTYDVIIDSETWSALIDEKKDRRKDWINVVKESKRTSILNRLIFIQPDSVD